MAIANRTATTANSGSSAATSLTLNKPTGTSAGDLLITTISINNGSSATITLLSGWTLLLRTNNTTVLGQGIYYRIADGTEGSSFAWSVTSEFVSGVCSAYTGVDNNNPFAVVAAGKGITTASTSQTYNATSQQAEVAYGVLCNSSRNTTATTTISTNSTSYTTDGSTCTTATDFIGTFVQDQHTTYGLPLVAVTPGATTLSTSSTGITVVLFLRPTVNTITGGFSTDFAQAAVQITASGTISFTGVTTGYTSEVLVLAIAGDAGATSNVSITSAGGLTWTKAVSNVTAHGSVYVFTAPASSKITNQTITATDSGDTSTDWGGALYSFVGGDSTSVVGASKTGIISTSGALSDTVTTTANNSWVWAITDDYNLSESHTVGSGQSMVTNELDASAGNTYFEWRQNAVTASSGTSVTMNVTTTDFYVYALFEILPTPSAATTHFLSSLGAGS
jgi:hypothetical protein